MTCVRVGRPAQLRFDVIETSRVDSIGSGAKGRCVIRLFRNFIILSLFSLVGVGLNYEKVSALGKDLADSVKTRLAGQQLVSIDRALSVYWARSGELPDDLDRVFEGGAGVDDALTDPWGNRIMISSGGYGYRVSSAGPDGRSGTDDDLDHERDSQGVSRNF